MTYTAVVFLTTLVTTVIISLLSSEAGECSKGLTFSSRKGFEQFMKPKA